MSKASLVVPCYNEAQRLDIAGWRELALHPDISIIFVDDGSTDTTAQLIGALVDSVPPGNAILLSRTKNGGKAEAVRAGMLHAIDGATPWVGYVDSDFATPASEIRRLIEYVLDDAPDVVLASRVRLLGHTIQRHAWRHFLGRSFASLASLCLDLPVYDTQCGCKFFRRKLWLASALAQPFASAWIFDVELLARLLYPEMGPGLPIEAFVEAPLLQWTDKPGSKVQPGDFMQASVDLCRLWFHLGIRSAAHEKPAAPILSVAPKVEKYRSVYSLSREASLSACENLRSNEQKNAARNNRNKRHQLRSHDY